MDHTNETDQAMEVPNIAAICVDRELRVQWFTPPVRELFGIDPTDTGRPLSEVSPAFEIEGLIEDARQVLGTEEPLEKEVRAGADTWVLARIRPHRTAEGERDGVVIAFVDTSVLQAAYRQVEREREYATEIVDTVREPLLVLDEELRVRSANSAFYDTFEVSPSETTGRRVYELGDGQWDNAELRRLWSEVLPEEKVVTDYTVDCEFERLGRRIMRLNARRIDEKELILLAIEDVTQRERAVRQLQEERNFIDAVINTVGALIVVVEPDGRIVQFNEECESVTGYSAEEVEGKNVYDLLIPPGDREGVEAVIRRHREGEDHTAHENRWMTKDGEERLIRWSSTVLRDEAGAITHVVGTGIDVTERRRLEREILAVSDEERRRIGEDLHDMLASQLVGTAMMTEGLARKMDEDRGVEAGELRQLAELIREAGEQVRRLSHSLMPLRVEGDHLADGLQSLAWRRDEMAGVECRFEAGADVPSITGEVASHLYRVATEAVSNALKHADPDRIVLRLEMEDEALVLSVWDDGIGIPDDPATGLGLNMMRYRANLIGADLSIGPAEDGGTLLRCRLPLSALSSGSEEADVGE